MGAAQMAQSGAPAVNIEEVGKEIFGLAGYRDGRRFIIQRESMESPEVAAAVQQTKQQYEQQLAQMIPQVQSMQQQSQELAQENEQLKAAAQSKQLDAQVKGAELQVKAQDSQASNQIAAGELQLKSSELELKAREVAIKEFEAETRRIAEQNRQLEILAQAQAQQQASDSMATMPQDPNADSMAQVMQAMQTLAQQVALLGQRPPQQPIVINTGEIEKPEDETKTIEIVGPTGGVYTGVKSGNDVVITAPSGAVYRGAIH
jgi:myosin heavy subunit